MRFPTLHLNGSGYENLSKQIRDANRALIAAHEALRQMAPHGRDYYVQGEGAWAEARKEHDARMDKLAEIAADLCAIYENIHDQQNARKAQAFNSLTKRE